MVAGALVQLGSNNNQTCSLFRTDPKKIAENPNKVKTLLGESQGAGKKEQGAASVSSSPSSGRVGPAMPR